MATLVPLFFAGAKLGYRRGQKRKLEFSRFLELSRNFLAFLFQDLKRTIIDESLLGLVNIVIIPHSGWDPNGPGNDTVWSTVFRNSSGILR